MPKVYVSLLLILLLFNKVNAQQYTRNQIDSLQKNKIISLVRKGQLEDALLLDIELVEKAKKINYENGVALGYIQIANFLCTFGKHLESLSYLELADNIVSVEENPILKAKIYSNYGRNFLSLKVNKKSIDYINKGIAICENKKSTNTNLLAILYTNKASAFLNTDYKLDSTLYYIHKATRVKETPFRYAVLTNYYLKQLKNIDSASYYLNKCKLLMKTTTVSAYQRSLILQAQANYYKHTGAYNTAIDYYKQCLNISNQIKKYKDIRFSYKLISETYELLGEDEKAHEYLLKYTNLNDSINNEFDKNVNIVINNFLKEQETHHKLIEKRLNLFFLLGSILSILILVFTTYYFRKKRRKIILEKELEIKLKSIESDQLKQKLNVAFEDVVSLAKNNDPSFLIRFQEVYPKVCKRLLEINPKLVNTELSLCAMIWLNFSSKDIASFTNVQPKTVQTKKYRLRKKLNIPEEANIYVWLKNIQ